MRRRRFAKLYWSDPDVRREWWTGYDEAKDTALADALGDPRLLERFRSGRSLPRGFGFSLDERIVEIPWVLANLPPQGSVLDAGSALNHPIILQRLMPRVSSLAIATFTEEEAHRDLGPTYTTADLRELPFADESFENVVCVSTLDHVGMDNSDYGSTERPSDDPDREVAAAISELRRVLRPGGRLLATVPYGRPENYGWCRQFDESGVSFIADSFGDGTHELRVYAHSRRRGWNRSTPGRAAKATYRDAKQHDRLLSNCAYAAAAVACISITVPE